MSENAKKAILRAKINGVLCEILPKTGADNVFLNDGTTLTSWISGVLADVALKATQADLVALQGVVAGKADAEHTHEMGEVNGLSTELAKYATTTALEGAVEALEAKLMGENAKEAYDTFAELAAYIEQHEEAAALLNTAIGGKADKAAFEELKGVVEGLGALAKKSVVSESDLDSALATKINEASAANHGHANKTVLDGITADKVSAWDAAEQNAKSYADGLAKNYDAKGDAAAAEQAAKTYADGLNNAMDARVQAVEGAKHTHANKSELDLIQSGDVAKWNNKSTVKVGDAIVDLEIEIVE